MKKITKLMILFTLLTIMLPLKAFALEPDEPHNADAMWVEPSEKDLTTVSVGYRFNVTIWANCSKTCTAWQFLLYYNSTYLNATGCWYTAGTSSEFFQGLGAIPVEPSFGPNSVLFAESCLLNLREPGYGSLAFVEFEVIKVPSEPVTFELDISKAYPEDTYLMVVLDGGEEGKLEPMDVSNATVIIPEFGTLAYIILVLIISSIAVVLKKYKKYNVKK